jgi:hypothetical protein
MSGLSVHEELMGVIVSSIKLKNLYNVLWEQRLML